MRIGIGWGLVALAVGAGCAERARPHLLCSDGSVEGPDGAIDLRTDPTNCGCLGQVCTGPLDANASPVCDAGNCGSRCAEGFVDCNHSAADGCESAVLTDTANCGACGNRCGGANGTAMCEGGRCTVTCLPGWADCDGSLANGCEADLNNRVDQCGACGTTCRMTHAPPVCRSGRCTHGSCEVGYDDCDGDETNGCETSLQDRNHCGMCGRQCMLPNATAACVMGACRIERCNDNFRDCDGSDVDGCEVDLRTDVNNCGTCMNRCQLFRTNNQCVAGSCQIMSCEDGWANCDGSVMSGCEVDLRTNSLNCGSCGNRCVSPNFRCTNRACTM